MRQVIVSRLGRFPSLAKEGLGVVRSISEQVSADVDRTTPDPSFAKEGNPFRTAPVSAYTFPVKIISCIKPVPDPASRLVINDSKTWIKDQDLTFVASEADNYALEEALRLKEKHGGEVVVISLGGDGAAKVLRSGLATGADRAIHLLDAKFRGGDESGTAEAI